MFKRNRNAGAVLIVALLLAGCSLMPAIFQTDPVGAGLYSLKSVYEGIVRSAGQAYLAGQINKEQLQSVIDPAKEFYNQYTTAVVLYDAKQLPNGEQKVAELRKNLDALQLRLQALMLKPPSRS